MLPLILLPLLLAPALAFPPSSSALDSGLRYTVRQYDPSNSTDPLATPAPSSPTSSSHPSDAAHTSLTSTVELMPTPRPTAHLPDFSLHANYCQSLISTVPALVLGKHGLELVRPFARLYPPRSSPSYSDLVLSGLGLATASNATTTDPGAGFLQNPVPSPGPGGSGNSYAVPPDGHIPDGATDVRAIAESFKVGAIGPPTLVNGTADQGQTVAVVSYPDNSRSSDPPLPAFCRFGASVVTSNETSVLFEVWLPLTAAHSPAGASVSKYARSHPHLVEGAWNGRMLMVGNSGQSGSVSYPDMKLALARHHFAVVSTNTGHIGSASSADWAINVESRIDFGYRAVHGSAVAAKEIVSTFYDVPPFNSSSAPRASSEPGSGATRRKEAENGFYSYFAGCSTGGRQALKEAQAFPDDFDGILAGSPANLYSHLNAVQIKLNSYLSNRRSPAYIPTWLYSIINAEVLRQCDHIDGVTDGIIADPRVCQPRLEAILCGTKGGRNASACLTGEQIRTVYNLYTPYIETNGTFIYDGLMPGSENDWAANDAGIPFPAAPGFYKYNVLNYTDRLTTSNTLKQYANFDTFRIGTNLTVIQLGDRINPGGGQADDRNLLPFFAKGGKIIQYHGWADQLIPPGGSARYYDAVDRSIAPALYNATGSELSSHYRLFYVPGMNHCRGGTYAASNFGGVSQTAYGMRPLSFDAEHDIIEALVQWTENGRTPDFVVAASYNDGYYEHGLNFTRKLCPYPQQAHYIGGGGGGGGGRVKKAKSFECRSISDAPSGERRLGSGGQAASGAVY